MNTWRFPYYDVNKGIDWVSIEREFDWFRDMKGVPQDPIWHAEGDVQIHTKMVCEALIALPEFQELCEQDKHIMFTGALMHDIEKRSTTKEDFRNGRICVIAPKHANRGEYTARRVLYQDIPTPFKIREEICGLVRYHGIPLWSVEDEDATERTIHATLYVRGRLLAMIAKADVIGRTAVDNPEQLEKAEYFKLLCEDLHIMDEQFRFDSNLARYHYLAKSTWIHYVPFDETKFTAHFMVGVAGSGKDSYIVRNNRDYNYPIPVVSFDAIRLEMGVDHGDQKGQGRVQQQAREQVRQHMRKGEDFFINATNLTRDLRGKWISLVEEYGGKVVAHYVEVPYKQLLSQNANREAKVPEPAIHKMIRKLEMPQYNEFAEIYHSVSD